MKTQLSQSFSRALRAMFKHKAVELTTAEVDETQYLLRGDANCARLLQAIKNIEDGQNLVDVSLDTLQ